MNFCYCKIGAGGRPCVDRETCDERGGTAQYLEPKTVEALMACEERLQFTYEVKTMLTKEDAEEHGLKLGDTLHRPVMEKASVTPISGDSIFCVVDADGQGWKPVLHESVWYKQKFFSPIRRF